MYSSAIMDFRFFVFTLVIAACQGQNFADKSHSSLLTSKTIMQVIQNETKLPAAYESLTNPIEGKTDIVKGDGHEATGTKILEQVQETTLEPHHNHSTVIHSYSDTTPTGSTTPNPNITTIIPTTDTNTTPVTSNTTTTTTTTTPTTTFTTNNATTIPPTTTTPEEGSWMVKNEHQGICIKVHMALEFNVTYRGKSNMIHNATVIVPKEAKASGNCSNDTQIISLNWGSQNSFTINFARNKTSGRFEIVLFNLSVNTDDFKDIQDNNHIMTFMNSKPEFLSTPLNKSYKCDKKQERVLKDILNVYNATLVMSHTQLEAFMTEPHGVFGEAEDCAEFDTPDLVPIAVGCVLCILVVVVLVAYVLGRRSQNRGYLSM